MRCVSCGKEIPGTAKVCPFCHRDTEESSKAHSILVLGCVVGFAIGYFVNGFWGAFLGGLAGGVVVSPFYAYFFLKGGVATAKVEVTKLPEPSEVPPAAPSGVAERLRELEALRKAGLVSEEEVQQKRKSILDGL